MQLSCNKHTNRIKNIPQAICQVTSGDPTQFINAETSKRASARISFTAASAASKVVTHPCKREMCMHA